MASTGVAMLFLLLALVQEAPAPQEAKASLQSCEMTAKGWVCHYQIPSVTIVRPLEPSEGDSPVPPRPVEASPPKPIEAPATDSAEAVRQTRLIAKCADATWKSLCLPGERKEARVLRDAAVAAAALNGKVTTLLSEQRCDEAVKVALEGGNMALAREARDFCAPSR
jgi:hypothetical protein